MSCGLIDWVIGLCLN